PKSQNNWVNEEKLFDDPDRLVHHSTYLGVPREWLGDRFFEDAEKLKARNEMAYRHEYLGEVTGTGGAVFENVEDMNMTDELVSSFDRLYNGCDFGFAVDPLAFTRMHYDAKRETLYIFDEVYQPKLKNKPAAEMIINRIGRELVIGDSAEPKTIAEMQELGVNMDGARKGRDSVEHGIKWLQNLEHIYIDKNRCPNTYREFVTYEYERNKEGQFISAYPDKNNHAIDSVRYACGKIIMGSRFGW
ncbi:PBSX family phage terminase large subunit, partial [Megasphaera vaginalis (ex Bordigoni et al. 2020)]